ncbi:MAG: gamma-glutamyltransferase [Gammaproteobacteria bacterium]|nr:gamma-glutamyltransferase [Gammaproteobacteria bacterium]
MNIFNNDFPYPSQRMPVMARNMVASSQPLAVQAGVDALRQGGNAVDAALATAITLSVVEPTSNGIGSDAFCIVWDGEKLHGLNASGRSPAGVSADQFTGSTNMPLWGWDSVTVPGCVSAWVALSDRFGKLPFENLFQAAIYYAREGYMVSPITAKAWAQIPDAYYQFPDFASFLPDGKPPLAGQLFRFPAQADTLESIASTRGNDFYKGSIAEKIENTARKAGAKLSAEDMASHQCDWVDLISVEYNGVELHEIPPNGQGLAALIMLGILKHHNISQYPIDSIESLHCQIEAMKLAFADAHRYIADPAFMDISVDELLNGDYLAERSKLIDMNKANLPTHGSFSKGGTVYLSTADQAGMMVSMIQSNYYGFGSGIVIPETGISLQNRGAGFSLTEGHPNQFGPSKRPYHTIIPAFLTQQGKPRMSFGVMGGPMQPQGHAQMVVRAVDYDQNPQVASDAPRWQVMENQEIALDAGYGEDIRVGLVNKGHVLYPSELDPSFSMGGAQLIQKTSDGYIAGSDHRKDGMAAGF